MKYKKQHYIPQSYLESWCDPNIPNGYNKYVWMFDYKGEKVKKKSPKNIFYQSEMYTIVDEKGNRILDIEHGLSGLESKFASIRDSKLLNQKELTSEDKIYVIAFVAAMHNRTLATKNHLTEQWGKVLDLGKKMKEAFENASSEQKRAMASIGSLSNGESSFTLEEVETLHSNPMQTLLIPRITAETNLYRNMNISILVTDDEVGFITSDNPCVWFDPELYKRPSLFQSPGLASPTIEVTMPLSPKQTILITHYPFPLYISVDTEQVDSINRKTRFHANEYYVVNQNTKKDFWFENIEPPAKN